MSVGIFDDELFSRLFGDELISDVFSISTTLANYIQFEVALTKALQEADVISEDVAKVIIEACKTFKPDLNELQSGVAKDGLAVPAFVKQLKDHIGGSEVEFLHFGATSQDLIDTSLMLSLKLLNREFALRIKLLVDSLEELIQRFGSQNLMGRTRMQAALPIEVKDRLSAWIAPLARQLEKLELLNEEVAVLQFGGAVGTRSALGEKGDMIAHRMANILELKNPPKTWHNQRDNLANYANWLSLVTGGLGKMGQDMCLMAQQGIDEITFSNAGSSSAMPHKQNPVLAETLVTLARFNAVQLSGLHQAMIHEQERSGAAWALEWMILPQMCAATASSLKNAQQLVGHITGIGSP